MLLYFEYLYYQTNKIKLNFWKLKLHFTDTNIRLINVYTFNIKSTNILMSIERLCKPYYLNLTINHVNILIYDQYEKWPITEAVTSQLHLACSKNTLPVRTHASGFNIYFYLLYCISGPYIQGPCHFQILVQNKLK